MQHTFQRGSENTLTQIPLLFCWPIQTRGKTKAKHLCLQAQLLGPRGFLLEEQSVCHKEPKMSRRGLRSAPRQLLTALYQSLELSWPLKLISNIGNDLSVYLCPGRDWRFEGRGAVPPKMIPAAGRVGIDSFLCLWFLFHIMDPIQEPPSHKSRQQLSPAEETKACFGQRTVQK